LVLNNFMGIHGSEEIFLEVNTRYHKLVDYLLENKFRIKKSVNRMLLTAFEGRHLEKSSHFVMRAWHA
jgi:hypothetical protein